MADEPQTTAEVEKFDYLGKIEEVTVSSRRPAQRDNAAPPEKGSPMAQDYEYRVRTYPNNLTPEDIETRINQETADGWRIVSAGSYFNSHVVYFERARPGQPEPMKDPAGKAGSVVIRGASRD